MPKANAQMRQEPSSVIDIANLRRLLDGRGEIAFLDVREEGQFGEGHPFFAVNTPYSRLELDVPRLVPRPSTPIVLADDGDGVAGRALVRLLALGYGDVRILQGGITGWWDAGLQLFKSVNVPSKAFAEVVEHSFHTPAIAAEELHRLLTSGADVKVLDSRTPEEFGRFHVPGAVSAPGPELVRRFDELVPSPETLVVVSCAGRTRGIIGAQTLINAKIPNRVVALAGGTQGWRLAGLDLEYGVPADATPALDLRGAQRRADDIRDRFDVATVDPDTLTRWLKDDAERRTTYLFDLRDADERKIAPLRGAIAAPGGQLVQALDRWVAVRNARLVLFDAGGPRTPITAHWLKQMGWDVYVAEFATSSRPAREADIPSPDVVPAKEAARLILGGAAVLSADPSAEHRLEHVQGARWVNRARLDRLPGDVLRAHTIVVTAKDARLAELVAEDLREIAKGRVVTVEGGANALRTAGLSFVATPADPPDAERIDFLFWAHDRHDGNPDAMRTYLAWEEQLPAQVKTDGGGGFRIKADA